MSAALDAHGPQTGGSLFPELSLSFFEHWCRSACSSLQYKTACVMPHVIRHSAASNDSYHRRRNLAEVQKRGRWESKKKRFKIFQACTPSASMEASSSLS